MSDAFVDEFESAQYSIAVMHQPNVANSGQITVHRLRVIFQ